jgi:hypothetical protein
MEKVQNFKSSNTALSSKTFRDEDIPLFTWSGWWMKTMKTSLGTADMRIEIYEAGTSAARDRNANHSTV